MTPARTLGCAFIAACWIGTTLLAQPAIPPPAERLAQLQAEIARHDELYFRQAATEISDAEYDALKQELRALLEAHPQLASSRATLTALGDDRTDRFPKARHRVPMQGLEKSFSEPELRRFLKRVAESAGGAPVAFVVEPKFDGLAISLVYEHGRLTRAVTRGNGIEGDLVTENLLACAPVPIELRAAADGSEPPAFVEIRGEVFLEHAEFDRLNAERLAAGESVHAHPRSLAVGTLKSSDPAILRSRRLSLVAYGWGAWEPAEGAPVSQLELLARLAAWGLTVPPAQAAPGPETVWQLVRALDVGRVKFPGPLDGAVIKVDDAVLRSRLGGNDDAPRWAIAHKFEPERVETRLRGITWQVGRTGLLTPVAELEPVLLGGSRVARASLQNRREIERRDYRIGDVVRVQKAGEIIPQLVGVNLGARAAESPRYVAPTMCPSCSTALAAGDATLRCPARACPAQVQRRIEHYVGDAALNLRGFGPAAVAALVERAGVRDAHELYTLTPARWRAVSEAGAGNPERLAAEIDRSRGAELWRVINGVGLPGVGAASARRLAEKFPGLPAVRDATESELMRAGFTRAGAAALRSELDRPETRAVLEGLIAAGVGAVR